MQFFDLPAEDLFPPIEAAFFRSLINTYNMHIAANAKKVRYYEGKIPFSAVNIGIAVPKAFSALSINCHWGQNAVDILAARSMFDGYVGLNGEPVEELAAIVEANRLKVAYNEAVLDELKFGCAFATLSRGMDGVAKIRFHSPMSAAAIWDGDEGRIACGFAITSYDTDEIGLSHPSGVNLYTSHATWVCSRIGDRWAVTARPHSLGRPLMVPLVWRPTLQKPFGRSRLKSYVRDLIDGYVRTMGTAAIALEFATSPQKYILGVTEDQFDAITSDKFRQYMGAILAATTNPETGQNPTVGQFPQGSLSPHVEELRILATQFSAATGLAVSDTGVVNDANPTSSDAIAAQTKTLVRLARKLNDGNAESLRIIGQMALALTANTTLEELTPEQRAGIPYFRDPSDPSVAQMADAALKIATQRPDFARTDVYLEMCGFGQADIRRIKSQEQRARGMATLEELLTEEDINGDSDAEGVE